MKLHYMGKFNLDPDSLPQAEHKPGAVEFKEADSMKKLSVIANTVACIILVILGAAAFFRIVPVAEPKSATITWFAALLGSIVISSRTNCSTLPASKKMCIFTQISSRACCSLSARRR